jgi:uncharacterized protein (DUF433 family)
MNAPQLDRIVHHPQILSGKATIRGTRISVALILEKLAWGRTVEGIIEDYPHLTQEDIQAALAYAHSAVETEIPLVAAE